MKKLLSILSLLLLLLSFGCTKHQVDTTSQVEVKPIHITIDVNIKVDRALDDFFSDIDETAKEIK